MRLILYKYGKLQANKTHDRKDVKINLEGDGMWICESRYAVKRVSTL